MFVNLHKPLMRGRTKLSIGSSAHVIKIGTDYDSFDRNLARGDTSVYDYATRL